LSPGDHGEALGSHGEGTHGFFIYNGVMRVPFIVATPFDELQGVRVDSQVSLVDVFRRCSRSLVSRRSAAAAAVLAAACMAVRCFR